VRDLDSLKYQSQAIALALKAAFNYNHVHELRPQQVIALSEEVGEFAGAARRYLGMARRPGSFGDMAEELADVIITGFVTAHVFDINLEKEIAAKLAIIFERGWKDW
jgi:NTP pyrophosphatase (non-canonical NTP hydrolase)